MALQMFVEQSIMGSSALKVLGLNKKAANIYGL